MVDKKIRVLCLHGIGANSKVFQAQTAALRSELGHDYEWHFVDGTIPVPMDSALKGLYPEDDQYYSYIDVNKPTYKDVLAELEEYIHWEGPFDLIGAACQSASLAAALSYSKETDNENSQLFKGAIFLSGDHPFDQAALKGNSLKFMESDNGHTHLAIPTANIWGLKDERARLNAPKLAALCNLETNFNFIHNSTSSIPQARDYEDLVGAAQVIRRTVDLALYAH